MMSKTEFVEKYGETYSEYGYYRNKEEINGCIFHRYETGGVSGGSCWDDSDPQEYHVSKQDNEFRKLDDLLSDVVPKLSFLEYKKINRLVKHNSEEDTEYYGNCTYYSVEYIMLDVLYDTLTEMGYTIDG